MKLNYAFTNTLDALSKFTANASAAIANKDPEMFADTYDLLDKVLYTVKLGISSESLSPTQHALNTNKSITTTLKGESQERIEKFYETQWEHMYLHLLDLNEAIIAIHQTDPENLFDMVSAIKELSAVMVVFMTHVELAKAEKKLNKEVSGVVLH